MNIKLNAIRISERLSRSSTAFEAVLWIDGVKVAKVGNYGQAGPHYYIFFNDAVRELMKKADAWCSTLPPKTYPAMWPAKTPLTIPMSLETMIDGIIFEYQTQQDLLQFRAKMEKHMRSSILFGFPDKSYLRLKYTIPLAILCHHQKGIEILKKDIHTKVVPLLKEGQKILNDNIPAEVIDALGLPGECWATSPLQTSVLTQDTVLQGDYPVESIRIDH
ncbi:MAG: hypothetical protein P4L51_06110 [Puia sp.]|nr:hypothetical protein [Puia sp.]